MTKATLMLILSQTSLVIIHIAIEVRYLKKNTNVGFNETLKFQSQLKLVCPFIFTISRSRKLKECVLYVWLSLGSYLGANYCTYLILLIILLISVKQNLNCFSNLYQTCWVRTFPSCIKRSYTYLKKKKIKCCWF